MIVRAAAMHRLVTVAGLYVQQDSVSNTLLVVLAICACLSHLKSTQEHRQGQETHASAHTVARNADNVPITVQYLHVLPWR